MSEINASKSTAGGAGAADSGLEHSKDYHRGPLIKLRPASSRERSQELVNSITKTER